MIHRRLTAVFPLLIVLSVATTAAADEMHPITKGVAKQLADADKPFVLVVEFTVKPENVDAFLAAMAEPITMTNKEPGNLAYELSRVVGDDDDDEEGQQDEVEFVLFEKWKSVAALDSHLKQPYLVKLLAAFDRLLAEAPEIEVCLPVAAGK